MNDHATNERLGWLRVQPFPKEKRVPEKPANWVLAEKYRPHGDPTADIEYQARAEKSWAKAREINMGGK